MLKLKLQYFGHLMRRTDWLEKTLMLGRTEGRRRRGHQRMRWLDGIIDLMNMNFEQALGVGEGQGDRVCGSPWGCRVRHNWATELNWMKKTDNIQCWQGHNKSRTLLYCWLKYKMLELPWKAASWFFKKIEFAHAIWCSNSTPRYLPQRNENMSTQRFLYTYS